MRSLHLLLLAVALTSLTACTDDPALPTSGPLAVSASASDDEGASALLEGRLVEKDGCVVVEPTEATMGDILPVLPGGARWSGEGLTYQGRTYAEGSMVSMGGGYYGPARSSSGLYLPATCVGIETFGAHEVTEYRDEP